MGGSSLGKKKRKSTRVALDQGLPKMKYVECARNRELAKGETGNTG